jgi:multicomponent Na+:H+ antiporter subunit F
MMDVVYSAVAIFLLLNILAGIVRTVRGPAASDRMITAQLFGTLGVGILLVLAEGLGRPALRDVALVYVILGVVAVVAFASRAWRPLDREDEL